MDIKARIAALLKMTPTNGCSEAEALAAARKAAALMLEYNLSRQDIEMSEEHLRSKTKGRSARDPLWAVVAECTNTAVVIESNAEFPELPNGITFVGRAPGPEIAGYLFVVLTRAIDRAVREFKKTPPYCRLRKIGKKRDMVFDFTHAMIGRLAFRLHEMFAPTMSKKARDDAFEVMARSRPDLIEQRPRQRKSVNEDAYFAGLRAGSAVELAHGVSGGGVRQLLEDAR